MSDFLANVDEIVISADTNPARFERFCVNVLTAVEGGSPVVATSVVWDLGRDGRGIGPANHLFVCTSLRDDVDVKAIEDIERLVQTTRNIRTLYFCSSQSLTEHRCEKIAAGLCEYLKPDVTVNVLGSKQLAELGRRYEVIDRAYGSEIKDILSRLSGDQSKSEELQGLRLALLSTGAEDSIQIREQVYRNGLLDVLSDGHARTSDKLAIDLSSVLRLGRSLDPACLIPYLSTLTSENLVDKAANGVYSINSLGVESLENAKAAGASSFVEGRNSIRKILEEAVGTPILDDDFLRIWTVFEDRLAFYLQSRGEQIVAEVTTLFGEATEGAVGNSEVERGSSLSFLEELADAVAASVRHSERQEVVRQAVKDMFSDRSGDAAKWLVTVCASFITACTLGLEYRSGEVVRALMRRISLVLDTDVVLSLLGEGEPEHEAVELIVKKWRENRGQVLIGTPVLQEAAYHAYIAQNDFEQVKLKLPGNEDYRLRLIENAFVRSFAHMMASRDVRLPHWRNYIFQFRGGSEYDHANLFQYLVAEYGLGKLPDRDAIKSSEVEAVKAFILDLVEAQKLRVGKNERDKAARDAELYVALVAHLARLREADPDAGCLLISSARRIAAVDAHFEMSGEARLVISISSALYLVSTLPTVSLGLSALKSFLFDERRQKFSSEFERTVLRMVSSSKEHSAFVFSRRGLLVRELKNRLVSRAEMVGGIANHRDEAEVERNSLKAENRESFVEALAASLDAVSTNTRTDKRLQDALRELAETKRQLEIQRNRKK